jgi:SAM-dependent methyltransferase
MMQVNLTAQEIVNKEWDGMAGEWDDLAGGYAKGFYEIIWKATGLDPNDFQGKIIVDFGCGTGLLTNKLREVSSQVLAIDASKKMMDMLEEKILTQEWENVHAATAQLGDLSIAGKNSRELIENMEGRTDLVVASSVISFIPSENLESTMAAIGRLLKPGGIFCHSDWPKSEDRPEALFTEEKAANCFDMAGLVAESTQIMRIDMGRGKESNIFVGVARKP